MLALYYFAAPLPGEKVIKVIHRDVFIVLKRILFFILLLLIPVIVTAMINFLFPALIEVMWVWPALVLASSAYLLFIWLLFFFSLIDYILDVWIITDQRIIDVRQKGFFSRSVSEVRHDHIQDISSEISGFFPTILKYGNVIVQSAGEQNKLFFEEVPNPESIRDMLMKMTTPKKNV